MDTESSKSFSSSASEEEMPGGNTDEESVEGN